MPSLDEAKQEGAEYADANSRPAAGIAAEWSMSLASVRGTLSGLLELMSLEARRAGMAVMWMVVLSVIAAICIVTAWLAFMAVLTICAMALGLHPLAAIGALSAINLIAGVVLIYRCIDLSRDLLFSATRRQVAGAPAMERSSS